MEHHIGLVDPTIKQELCFDCLLQASESFNRTASSVEIPNHRCLLASLPEHAQHTLSDVTNLFVLPLDTLLALCSVTFNTVILVAILRTRSIQRPSLLLLCSLSTTDVIWAIFSAIHNTKSFILKNICPKELFKEEFFVVVLCFFSTLGNLAVISCDRLLAVNNPWWYRSHATRSHAVKQITLVWIIALTFSGMAAGYQHNKSPLLWSLNLYLSKCICYLLCLDHYWLLHWSTDCKSPTWDFYASLRGSHAHSFEARETNC